MRAGVAIDRCRRTAKDEALYKMVTLPVTTLNETISGSVEPEDDEKSLFSTILEGDISGSVESEEDEKLLIYTIEHLEQLGGGNSRGLGWVKMCIKKDGKGVDQIVGTTSDAATLDKTFHKVTLILKPTAPFLVGEHTSESNYRASKQIIPGAVIKAALNRKGLRTDYVTLKASTFYPNYDTSEETTSTFQHPLLPEEMDKRKRYINWLPITARQKKYGHVTTSEEKDGDITVYDALASILSGKNSSFINRPNTFSLDDSYILTYYAARIALQCVRRDYILPLYHR
jgi:hypothetical protein